MFASNLLLRAGVAFGIVAMTMGIVMGIAREFQFAPVHAHLNLVGFVLPALYGLYYRQSPDIAATKLARVQAAHAVLGGLLLPIGIGGAIAGFDSVFVPVAIVGSLLAVAGLIMFAFVVWRPVAMEPRAMGAAAQPAE